MITGVLCITEVIHSHAFEYFCVRLETVIIKYMLKIFTSGHGFVSAFILSFLFSDVIPAVTEFEYSASALLFEAILIALHAVKIAAFILAAFAFWQLVKQSFRSRL